MKGEREWRRKKRKEKIEKKEAPILSTILAIETMESLSSPYNFPCTSNVKFNCFDAVRMLSIII